MKVIIIFIGIIIGLNFIPHITKKSFPKMEQIIKRALIVSIILFLIVMIFDYNGYKLKNIFVFRLIGLFFLLPSVIYFSIFKNTLEKILKVLLLTVLIIVSITNQILYEKLDEYKITDELNMIISQEGFLNCGEVIRITKSEFGIFEKELFYDNKQCLTGINRVETIKIDENSAKFLIYHDGIMDSENPYEYKIENKNGW